jgi:hypothetical protein
MRKISQLVCSLAGLLILAGAPAMAHHLDQLDPMVALESNVKDADFVFQGRVTNVTYHNSTANKTSVALPHTFVTFQVEQVFKGKQTQDLITLRFIGGAAQNGTTMQAGGVPLFDVGDQDVLFVKDNGKSSCPLVGCAQGRYRLIGKQVYNDEGREIFLSAGKLLRGRSVPLEEVLTNTIGTQTIRQVEVVEPGESTFVDEPTPPGQALDPTTFKSFLTGQVQRFFRADQLAKLPAVRSLSIGEEFFVSKPKAELPPQAGPEDAPLARTAQESYEQEQLRKNGGNPVIPPFKP